MTYEIVISKTVVNVIGSAFMFIGCLLIGIAIIVFGCSIYTIQDKILPLPVRVLISAFFVFAGLFVIAITVLETFGIAIVSVV